jgi:hypothetical protein
MSKPKRFYLNKERYVIDRLDWLNNGLSYMPAELPHSENDMRRDVFSKRLNQLIECLLSPYVGKKHGPFEPQRYEDAARAITTAAMTICEAHVDQFIGEPRASIRPNEKAAPVRRISAITSIGLFLRDLEFLVRNIYGKGGRDFVIALDRAIVGILKVVMKGVVKHLWREYDEACVADGDLRVSGYYCSWHWTREDEAFDWIVARAQKVRENPNRFGKYTIEFVKRLDRNFVVVPVL